MNPRNVGVIEDADDIGNDKGQTLIKMMKLTNEAVAESLDGVPEDKLHGSVLTEGAIKTAAKNYYDKNGIRYDHFGFQIKKVKNFEVKANDHT